MKATAMFALRGMEHMHPRPPPQVFEMNRKYEREADEKLKKFPAAEVEAAMKSAIEEQAKSEIERQALVQAWARQNPGQTHMEVGGPETQQLYDEVLAKPAAKENRAENYSCAYCGKSSTVKLKACARCLKVSYCGKECQTPAWKAHKLECVPWNRDRDPKTLDLTWDQVQANGNVHFKGRTLEVRAILDESMTRQVFQCKDRVGTIRRVAAYTHSRAIPGLQQGSILRWKNPRYHYFMDGSSGARIEEDDLKNVTIL